jgi:hypothetical protein
MTEELAKTDAIPAFMDQYRGKGLEGLGKADLDIPRIKLLQALSPECTEFDDARPGHFWHTLSDTSLGRSIKVVPVYTDISYILWRPRHAGGGILARAADGIHWNPSQGIFQVQLVKDGPFVTWQTKNTVAQSGLAEWGSSSPGDANSQPAATKMYNVAIILPDLDHELSPAVVTMQRSAITVARKFMAKLKISNLPSFGQYYTMESVPDQSALGTFFNYKFTKVGLVQDEAEFKAYTDTYEAFKSLGLNIRDLAGAQDDDPAPVTTDKF